LQANLGEIAASRGDYIQFDFYQKINQINFFKKNQN
jgi:hypothetical protein